MPGWRCSAYRTGLRPNSLQTGNFTGKITISGLKATILKQETAVLQGLLSRFPKQTNREFFSREQLVSPGLAGCTARSIGASAPGRKC
jgi:hypothetical protein